MIFLIKKFSKTDFRRECKNGITIVKSLCPKELDEIYGSMIITVSIRLTFTPPQSQFFLFKRPLLSNFFHLSVPSCSNFNKNMIKFYSGKKKFPWILKKFNDYNLKELDTFLIKKEILPVVFIQMFDFILLAYIEKQINNQELV